MRQRQEGGSIMLAMTLVVVSWSCSAIFTTQFGMTNPVGIKENLCICELQYYIIVNMINRQIKLSLLYSTGVRKSTTTPVCRRSSSYIQIMST